MSTINPVLPCVTRWLWGQMNSETQDVTRVFGGRVPNQLFHHFYVHCSVFGQSLWVVLLWRMPFGCQALGVWSHMKPAQQGGCQTNKTGFLAVYALLTEELALFPGS